MKSIGLPKHQDGKKSKKEANSKTHASLMYHFNTSVFSADTQAHLDPLVSHTGGPGKTKGKGRKVSEKYKGLSGKGKEKEPSVTSALSLEQELRELEKPLKEEVEVTQPTVEEFADEEFEEVKSDSEDEGDSFDENDDQYTIAPLQSQDVLERTSASKVKSTPLQSGLFSFLKNEGLYQRSPFPEGSSSSSTSVQLPETPTSILQQATMHVTVDGDTEVEIISTKKRGVASTPKRKRVYSSKSSQARAVPKAKGEYEKAGMATIRAPSPPAKRKRKQRDDQAKPRKKEKQSARASKDASVVEMVRKQFDERLDENAVTLEAELKTLYTKAPNFTKEVDNLVRKSGKVTERATARDFSGAFHDIITKELCVDGLVGFPGLVYGMGGYHGDAVLQDAWANDAYVVEQVQERLAARPLKGYSQCFVTVPNFPDTIDSCFKISNSFTKDYARRLGGKTNKVADYLRVAAVQFGSCFFNDLLNVGNTRVPVEEALSQLQYNYEIVQDPVNRTESSDDLDADIEITEVKNVGVSEADLLSLSVPGAKLPVDRNGNEIKQWLGQSESMFQSLHENFMGVLGVYQRVLKVIQESINGTEATESAASVQQPKLLKNIIVELEVFYKVLSSLPMFQHAHHLGMECRKGSDVVQSEPMDFFLTREEALRLQEGNAWKKQQTQETQNLNLGEVTFNCRKGEEGEVVVVSGRQIEHSGALALFYLHDLITFLQSVNDSVDLDAETKDPIQIPTRLNFGAKTQSRRVYCKTNYVDNQEVQDSTSAYVTVRVSGLLVSDLGDAQQLIWPEWRKMISPIDRLTYQEHVDHNMFATANLGSKGSSSKKQLKPKEIKSLRGLLHDVVIGTATDLFLKAAANYSTAAALFKTKEKSFVSPSNRLLLHVTAHGKKQDDLCTEATTITQTVERADDVASQSQLRVIDLPLLPNSQEQTSGRLGQFQSVDPWEAVISNQLPADNKQATLSLATLFTANKPSNIQQTRVHRMLALYRNQAWSQSGEQTMKLGKGDLGAFQFDVYLHGTFQASNLPSVVPPVMNVRGTTHLLPYESLSAVVAQPEDVLIDEENTDFTDEFFCVGMPYTCLIPKENVFLYDYTSFQNRFVNHYETQVRFTESELGFVPYTKDLNNDYVPTQLGVNSNMVLRLDKNSVTANEEHFMSVPKRMVFAGYPYDLVASRVEHTTHMSSQISTTMFENTAYANEQPKQPDLKTMKIVDTAKVIKLLYQTQSSSQVMEHTGLDIMNYVGIPWWTRPKTFHTETNVQEEPKKIDLTETVRSARCSLISYIVQQECFLDFLVKARVIASEAQSEMVSVGHCHNLRAQDIIKNQLVDDMRMQAAQASQEVLNEAKNNEDVDSKGKRLFGYFDPLQRINMNSTKRDVLMNLDLATPLHKHKPHDKVKALDQIEYKHLENHIQNIQFRYTGRLLALTADYVVLRQALVVLKPGVLEHLTITRGSVVPDSSTLQGSVFAEQKLTFNKPSQPKMAFSPYECYAIPAKDRIDLKDLILKSQKGPSKASTKRSENVQRQLYKDYLANSGSKILSAEDVKQARLIVRNLLWGRAMLEFKDPHRLNNQGSLWLTELLLEKVEGVDALRKVLTSSIATTATTNYAISRLYNNSRWNLAPQYPVQSQTMNATPMHMPPTESVGVEFLVQSNLSSGSMSPEIVFPISPLNVSGELGDHDIVHKPLVEVMTEINEMGTGFASRAITIVKGMRVHGDNLPQFKRWNITDGALFDQRSLLENNLVYGLNQDYKWAMFFQGNPTKADLLRRFLRQFTQPVVNGPRSGEIWKVLKSSGPPSSKRGSVLELVDMVDESHKGFLTEGIIRVIRHPRKVERNLLCPTRYYRKVGRGDIVGGVLLDDVELYYSISEHFVRSQKIQRFRQENENWYKLITLRAACDIGPKSLIACVFRSTELRNAFLVNHLDVIEMWLRPTSRGTVAYFSKARFAEIYDFFELMKSLRVANSNVPLLKASTPPTGVVVTNFAQRVQKGSTGLEEYPWDVALKVVKNQKAANVRLALFDPNESFVYPPAIAAVEAEVYLPDGKLFVYEKERYSTYPLHLKKWIHYYFLFTNDDYKLLVFYEATKNINIGDELLVDGGRCILDYGGVDMKFGWFSELTKPNVESDEDLILQEFYPEQYSLSEREIDIQTAIKQKKSPAYLEPADYTPDSPSSVDLEFPAEASAEETEARRGPSDSADSSLLKSPQQQPETPETKEAQQVLKTVLYSRARIKWEQIKANALNAIERFPNKIRLFTTPTKEIVGKRVLVSQQLKLNPSSHYENRYAALNPHNSTVTHHFYGFLFEFLVDIFTGRELPEGQNPGLPEYNLEAVDGMLQKMVVDFANLAGVEHLDTETQKVRYGGYSSRWEYVYNRLWKGHRHLHKNEIGDQKDSTKLKLGGRKDRMGSRFQVGLESDTSGNLFHQQSPIYFTFGGDAGVPISIRFSILLMIKNCCPSKETLLAIITKPTFNYDEYFGSLLDNTVNCFVNVLCKDTNTVTAFTQIIIDVAKPLFLLELTLEDYLSDASMSLDQIKNELRTEGWFFKMATGLGIFNADDAGLTAAKRVLMLQGLLRWCVQFFFQWLGMLNVFNIQAVDEEDTYPDQIRSFQNNEGPKSSIQSKAVPSNFDSGDNPMKQNIEQYNTYDSETFLNLLMYNFWGVLRDNRLTQQKSFLPNVKFNEQVRMFEMILHDAFVSVDRYQNKLAQTDVIFFTQPDSNNGIDGNGFFPGAQVSESNLTSGNYQTAYQLKDPELIELGRGPLVMTYKYLEERWYAIEIMAVNFLDVVISKIHRNIDLLSNNLETNRFYDALTNDFFGGMNEKVLQQKMIWGEECEDKYTKGVDWLVTTNNLQGSFKFAYFEKLVEKCKLQYRQYKSFNYQQGKIKLSDYNVWNAGLRLRIDPQSSSPPFADLVGMVCASPEDRRFNFYLKFMRLYNEMVDQWSNQRKNLTDSKLPYMLYGMILGGPSFTYARDMLSYYNYVTNKLYDSQASLFYLRLRRITAVLFPNALRALQCSVLNPQGWYWKKLRNISRARQYPFGNPSNSENENSQYSQEQRQSLYRMSELEVGEEIFLKQLRELTEGFSDKYLLPTGNKNDPKEYFSKIDYAKIFGLPPAGHPDICYEGFRVFVPSGYNFGHYQKYYSSFDLFADEKDLTHSRPYSPKPTAFYPKSYVFDQEIFRVDLRNDEETYLKKNDFLRVIRQSSLVMQQQITSLTVAKYEMEKRFGPNGFWLCEYFTKLQEHRLVSMEQENWRRRKRALELEIKTIGSNIMLAGRGAKDMWIYSQPTLTQHLKDLKHEYYMQALDGVKIPHLLELKKQHDGVAFNHQVVTLNSQLGLSGYNLALQMTKEWKAKLKGTSVFKYRNTYALQQNSAWDTQRYAIKVQSLDDLGNNFMPTMPMLLCIKNILGPLQAALKEFPDRGQKLGINLQIPMVSFTEVGIRDLTNPRSPLFKLFGVTPRTMYHYTPGLLHALEQRDVGLLNLVACQEHGYSSPGEKEAEIMGMVYQATEVNSRVMKVFQQAVDDLSMAVQDEQNEDVHLQNANKFFAKQKKFLERGYDVDYYFIRVLKLTERSVTRVWEPVKPNQRAERQTNYQELARKVFGSERGEGLVTFSVKASFEEELGVRYRQRKAFNVLHLINQSESLQKILGTVDFRPPLPSAAYHFYHQVITLLKANLNLSRRRLKNLRVAVLSEGDQQRDKDPMRAKKEEWNNVLKKGVFILTNGSNLDTRNHLMHQHNLYDRSSELNRAISQTGTWHPDTSELPGIVPEVKFRYNVQVLGQPTSFAAGKINCFALYITDDLQSCCHQTIPVPWEDFEKKLPTMLSEPIHERPKGVYVNYPLSRLRQELSEFESKGVRRVKEVISQSETKDELASFKTTTGSSPYKYVQDMLLEKVSQAKLTYLGRSALFIRLRVYAASLVEKRKAYITELAKGSLSGSQREVLSQEWNMVKAVIEKIIPKIQGFISFFDVFDWERDTIRPSFVRSEILREPNDWIEQLEKRSGDFSTKVIKQAKKIQRVVTYEDVGMEIDEYGTAFEESDRPKVIMDRRFDGLRELIGVFLKLRNEQPEQAEEQKELQQFLIEYAAWNQDKRSLNNLIQALEKMYAEYDILAGVLELRFQKQAEIEAFIAEHNLNPERFENLVNNLPVGMVNKIRTYQLSSPTLFQRVLRATEFYQIVKRMVERSFVMEYTTESLKKTLHNKVKFGILFNSDEKEVEQNVNKLSCFVEKEYLGDTNEPRLVDVLGPRVTELIFNAQQKAMEIFGSGLVVEEIEQRIEEVSEKMWDDISCLFVNTYLRSENFPVGIRRMVWYNMHLKFNFPLPTQEGTLNDAMRSEEKRILDKLVEDVDGFYFRTLRDYDEIMASIKSNVKPGSQQLINTLTLLVRLGNRLRINLDEFISLYFNSMEGEPEVVDYNSLYQMVEGINFTNSLSWKFQETQLVDDTLHMIQRVLEDFKSLDVVVIPSVELKNKYTMIQTDLEALENSVKSIELPLLDANVFYEIAQKVLYQKGYSIYEALNRMKTDWEQRVLDVKNAQNEEYSISDGVLKQERLTGFWKAYFDFKLKEEMQFIGSDGNLIPLAQRPLVLPPQLNKLCGKTREELSISIRDCQDSISLLFGEGIDLASSSSRTILKESKKVIALFHSTIYILMVRLIQVRFFNLLTGGDELLSNPLLEQKHVMDTNFAQDIQNEAAEINKLLKQTKLVLLGSDKVFGQFSSISRVVTGDEVILSIYGVVDDVDEIVKQIEMYWTYIFKIAIRLEKVYRNDLFPKTITQTEQFEFQYFGVSSNEVVFETVWRAVYGNTGEFVTYVLAELNGLVNKIIDPIISSKNQDIENEFFFYEDMVMKSLRLISSYSGDKYKFIDLMEHESQQTQQTSEESVASEWARILSVMEDRVHEESVSIMSRFFGKRTVFGNWLKKFELFVTNFDHDHQRRQQNVEQTGHFRLTVAELLFKEMGRMIGFWNIFEKAKMVLEQDRPDIFDKSQHYKETFKNYTEFGVFFNHAAQDMADHKMYSNKLLQDVIMAQSYYVRDEFIDFLVSLRAFLVVIRQTRCAMGLSDEVFSTEKTTNVYESYIISYNLMKQAQTDLLQSLKVWVSVENTPVNIQTIAPEVQEWESVLRDLRREPFEKLGPLMRLVSQENEEIITLQKTDAVAEIANLMQTVMEITYFVNRMKNITDAKIDSVQQWIEEFLKQYQRNWQPISSKQVEGLQGLATKSRFNNNSNGNNQLYTQQLKRRIDNQDVITSRHQFDLIGLPETWGVRTESRRMQNITERLVQQTEIVDLMIKRRIDDIKVQKRQNRKPSPTVVLLDSDSDSEQAEVFQPKIPAEDKGKEREEKIVKRTSGKKKQEEGGVYFGSKQEGGFGDLDLSTSEGYRQN